MILAILVPACAREPGPTSRVERVVRRLDANAFIGLPTVPHSPVVRIGEEARAVVLRPEEIVVAESLGVPSSDGVVKLEVELAPEVAALPDAAFLLATQELRRPWGVDEEAMKHLAELQLLGYRRRPTGWHLDRSPESRRATLEISSRESPGPAMNVRLTALLPTPRSVESRSFDLPVDARLQLGFGIAWWPEVEGAPAEESPGVQFVATLTCRDHPPREILRRTVSTATAATWHDDVVSIGARSACRLGLATTAGGGPVPPGTVWAVPRILAPDPAGDMATNLVLISLDTLRGDHLAGLGYPRDTTPVIDAEMMAKGAAFTDVTATFPMTDVSHLSMFSGLYPHAQPQRGRVRATDRLVLLSELLQKTGLETIAFAENALVSGRLGFWFGFDAFTERTVAADDRGGPTVERAIRYLRANRAQRFFLFLHTYKTHSPYVPSEPYEALWGDGGGWREGRPAPQVPEKHRENRDRYDRTIREADALVGRVLRALEDLGLAQRTFVVLTSDHGEAFGEHGLGQHGFSAHQEALRVPLILRGPGIPPGLRVDTPVSIVDVMPTLLDLFGVPVPTYVQGTSLMPALRGEPLADRPLFFGWLVRDAAGVRWGHHKYLRTAKSQWAFDLAEDPRERSRDARPADTIDGARLLSGYEAESARLRRQLGPARGAGAEAGGAIDERLRESLEALGYL